MRCCVCYLVRRFELTLLLPLVTISKDLSDLKKTVDVVNLKLDFKRLKIASGAAFDSYDNRHAECLPGTRTELLRKIEEWSRSAEGKCIFWLNGMAGTGKSTISRTVASRLQDQSSLGASFFFKRGEADRANAKRLFPTLIAQLVKNIPQLVPQVERTVEDDPQISERGISEQFKGLVMRPLLRTEQVHTDVMIVVIDALDECEQEDDVKLILRLLPHVQQSNSVRLRFLLTSRPELAIRLGFNDIGNEYQNLILHDIPMHVIERDISLFLKHRVSEIRQQSSDRWRGLSPGWPGDGKIMALVSMSIPLFIAAATICRVLEDPQWPPEDSLKEILSHQSDNSNLDATYLPVLNRLLANQAKSRKDTLVREYRMVIGVIIMLETPLAIAPLSRLIGISQNLLCTRLDSLHSVFSIPTDGSKPVRPFHLSFRDFLIDPDTHDKTPFGIDEKEMHEVLTEQCLQVMGHGLRKNICNLPGEGTLRQDISKETVDQCLSSELQYSCRYWTHHLQRSQDPLGALDSAFCFLQEHFLHWVEVMGILGVISEAVGAIHRLQAIIRVSLSDCRLLQVLRVIEC